MARVRVVATHQGEFMGVPASGKHAEIELIDVMRFDAAGHICEHWGVADMLTSMQQIGAVPGGPPASERRMSRGTGSSYNGTPDGASAKRD